MTIKIHFKPIIIAFCFLALMFFSCSLSSLQLNTSMGFTNSSQSLTTSLPAWNWAPPEVISTGSDYDSVNAQIVADDDGNVHLVYQDGWGSSGGSTANITYSRWNVNTKQWSSPEIVSTESINRSTDPSIALDSNNNLHVVWQDTTNYTNAGTDTDLCYKVRNFSSGSWSSLEIVTLNSTGNSYSPVIDIDSQDNIHLVWTDYSDYLLGSGPDVDVFHIQKFSNNNSWSKITLISEFSDNESYLPYLKIDNSGRKHFAWSDYSTIYDGDDNDDDIVYRKSFPNSNLLSDETLLFNKSNEYSEDVNINVDSKGNVYVAWYSNEDYMSSGTDWDIFFMYWNSTTGKWTNTTVVSLEATAWNDWSESPIIEVDSQDNIHLIYSQRYADILGADQYEILYHRFDVDNKSWSSPWMVTTDTNGSARMPDFCVDKAGHIHVTWRDDSNYLGSGSDIDTFYKKYSGVPLTPVLNAITPNPANNDSIILEWMPASAATHYSIYRDTSYISDIQSLSPIATVSSCYYVDSIMSSETHFYYAITAENGAGDSSLSNCVHVEVQYPASKADGNTTSGNTTNGSSTPFFSEFYVVTVGSTVLLLSCVVVFRKRRR